MHRLLSVIWFILPAGIASIAPVPAARLFPTWNARIDGGKSFRGLRIFGDHETVRGLVAGMFVATLIFAAQRSLVTTSDRLRSLIVMDHASTPVCFGTLMGFGAMFGDLVGSFFKRGVGPPPGAP